MALILKNTKILSLAFLFMPVIFSCSESIKTKTDSKIASLQNELIDRIYQSFDVQIKMPHITFSDSIFSNAQYKNDTILLGKRFRSDYYFTDEDRLSILFHEYIHFLTEKLNIFQYKKDESGNIIQIYTNQLYKTKISEIELKNDLESMKRSGISTEQINCYKTAVKIPIVMRFLYSPSNLSREELLCYTIEKVSNKFGVFKHSKQYNTLLNSRIKVEKMHLKMRLKYEKENSLNIDGMKIIE